MTQPLEVRASSQIGRRPRLDLASRKPDQTPACAARPGWAPHCQPPGWSALGHSYQRAARAGPTCLHLAKTPQLQAPLPTVLWLFSPSPAHFGHLVSTCWEEIVSVSAQSTFKRPGFLSFSARLILPSALVEGAGDETRTSRQRQSHRSEQLETLPGSLLQGHTPRRMGVCSMFGGAFSSLRKKS